MVYRVYVEKRPGLTAEADALAGDIRTLLGISLSGEPAAAQPLRRGEHHAGAV